MKHMDKVVERAGDISAPLNKGADIVAAGIKKNWDTKGAYFGSGWPAIAETTLLQKLHDGYPSETLVATGALKNSLTGGSDWIRRLAKTQITLGTRNYKSRFHQGGVTSRGLPKRKVLAITAADRKKIFQIFVDHFAVLRGRG